MLFGQRATSCQKIEGPTTGRGGRVVTCPVFARCSALGDVVPDFRARSCFGGLAQ